jgi:nitroreductase
MRFEELVVQNRSRRRFKQDQQVDMYLLRELISLARLCPSGSNLQPLKYLLINTQEKNDIIFMHLSWAGYIKDWHGPEKGEQPSAYIVILGDINIKRDFGVDHGIAAQTIMLGAVEKGLGGCIIGSINKKALTEDLKIPKDYELLLVLALGIPNEEVIIEPVDQSGNIQYWRDKNNVHHVPKRSLKEIILEHS